MTKKLLILFALLSLILAFTTAFAFNTPTAPRFAVTANYVCEDNGKETTEEFEVVGFSELDDLWYFESGDDEYDIVSGEVTLLEDYTTEYGFEIPEWVTLFDGDNHTITLSTTSQNYTTNGVLYFPTSHDLTISNLTLVDATGKVVRGGLFVNSYLDIPEKEGIGGGQVAIDELPRNNIVIDNVTAEGGIDGALTIYGYGGDFTITGCSLTPGEKALTHVYYMSTNDYAGEGIMLGDSSTALDLACSFDISSDNTFVEGTSKIHLGGDALRVRDENMNQLDELTELVNEHVSGVEVKYGMLARLDREEVLEEGEDGETIYFKEIDGFHDIDSYVVILSINNFFEMGNWTTYLDEGAYNMMVSDEGVYVLAEDALEYMRKDIEPEGEGDMAYYLSHMDIDVELLGDVTLFPEDVIEYYIKEKEEDLPPRLFQGCNVSINGNGYTYTIGNYGHVSPFVIFGYGETVYENVVFDASSLEDCDYVFMFVSDSEDYQSTVTLDTVSVIGGNRAAILVAGSDVTIIGGNYTCNEGGIGGIEYGPYVELVDPFYGALEVDDDVTSDNEHRVFAHKEILEIINEEDTEAAVELINETITGTRLVLDEEDGNAYEEAEAEPEEPTEEATEEATEEPVEETEEPTEEPEEPTEYNVTYTWKKDALDGVELPADDKVQAGSTYKAVLPTKSGYSFTADPEKVKNVSEDITIKISYSKKTFVGGGGSTTSKYTIATPKVEGATISPENPSVKKGESQEFIITPNDGKEIADVLLDGTSVGAVSKYTVENVTKAHKLEVLLKDKEFTGTSKWAKSEMTEAAGKGLIPETIQAKNFSASISRKDFAAVAVRLYEALSGKEAMLPAKNPFKDTNDSYVLKAFELGITNGVSEDEFNESLPIPREQMTTMMGRAISKAGVNTFVDLGSIQRFTDDGLMHDWSRPSIYFMNIKNIINGMGENRFGVAENSTIEQAVAVSLRAEKAFEK